MGKISLVNLINAEKNLQEVEEKGQRLLKSDQPKQALKTLPNLITAQRKAWQARGRYFARAGGDLWECVAWYLTGGPVDLKWENPETGSLGITKTEEWKVPVVMVSPFMPATDCYEVFLHEMGHVLHNALVDPSCTSKALREGTAKMYAEGWEKYADEHWLDYREESRSGIEARLLALLDYPTSFEIGK